MYSDPARTTLLRTNTPALRAARSAIMIATVTDTSANAARGSYRHPPSLFCAATANAFACSSVPRTFFWRCSSGIMPHTSARNRLANP